MKPSDSPVHDCIKENHETLAKEDVDFQEMDFSNDGHFENEDEKHIYLLFHDCSLFLVLMERDLNLVPSVLETMNNHGKVDINLVPSVLETMNNHGKVDIYGYNFTKCWLLPHFRWTI